MTDQPNRNWKFEVYVAGELEPQLVYVNERDEQRAHEKALRAVPKGELVVLKRTLILSEQWQ